MLLNETVQHAIELHATFLFIWLIPTILHC